MTSRQALMPDDEARPLRASGDCEVDDVNDMEAGGRRRRSSGSSAPTTTLALVTLLLLLLLGVCGGAAWWLHSPSSATVDSRFVWWQRLFAEHGDELASVAPAADSGSNAVAASSAVVAVHSALAREHAVCTNTVQGRDLVTDDQGYVCAPAALDAARPGCCRMPAETGFERFSCETCDARLGCCGVYEFCVACCLGPQNRAPVDALRHAASSEHALQVCAALCRTSSLSVTGQRQYRNAKKHCFAAGTNSGGAGFIRVAPGGGGV